MVKVSATAACALELLWLDSALVVKYPQIVACPAFDYKETQPLLRPIETEAGDRLRVIVVAAVAGSVSATLDVTL